jgi:glycosyltransferase involved in cell wall biosynthesis
MKVCFFSFTHFYDDMRILHKEAHSLAKAGHEVVHLAPGDGDAPAQVNGVAIKLYRRRHPILRSFTLLWHGLKLRSNAYHCNEVESWLLGLIIKCVRPGTIIVFDVHEHYPSRFDQPHIPRWVRHPGEWLLRFIFNVCTPNTDFLIFAKRSVAPDFPAIPNRTAFVFNYAANHIVVPTRESVSADVRAHFRARFTAIHLGDLSISRGWPQLLQAMHELSDLDLNVIQLGSIFPSPEHFHEENKRLGISNRIILVDKVPYQDVFSYLACADCGLMLYQPGIQNHVFAFPMKLYDYLQAGLPVIGPDFAIEVSPVFSEFNCGLLIDTSSSSSLAITLRYLATHATESMAMGQRGKNAVQNTFSWEGQERVLLDLYKQLGHSETHTIL